MIRFTSVLLFLGLLLSSCGGDSRSQDDLKADIQSREKKIEKLSEKIENAEKVDEESEELVNVLLEFYRAYPEEDYAAGCLAKVHMIYSRQGDFEKATAYADTLLENYPSYVDRAQIIESQITTYEMMIEPRDVEKIRGYLKLWLKENKDAPKEKISDMEYHLKFVNMSLEDRMRMNMEELD